MFTIVLNPALNTKRKRTSQIKSTFKFPKKHGIQYFRDSH